MIKLILPLIFLVGCSSSVEYERQAKVTTHADEIVTGYGYYGWNENSHRSELKELLGVDPVQTEWCAAFVNAVLKMEDKEGSESVSAFPLTARSFLMWGEETKTPKSGDVVVFPRGEAWQGHVGFYVRTTLIEGVPHYVILGGNQEDSVSLEFYPVSKAIGIRRHSPQPS
jgi:uncharacterized protein (TIGR02594 family)